MKILALRERFDHMGSHSGYDELFVHLEKKRSVETVWKVGSLSTSSVFKTVPKWLFSTKGYNLLPSPLTHLAHSIFGKRFESASLIRIMKAIKDIKSSFYTPSSLHAELQFIKELKVREFNVAHLAYLENQFGLLGARDIQKKLSDVYLVGTVHQTFEWWRENGNVNALGILDGLIVLAEHEKEKWEKIMPGRVHFIPHGVDVNFFTPSNQSNSKFSCVFTGFWNRDFNTLKKVIDQVLEREKDVMFDLVIPENRLEDLEEFIRHIRKLKNVHFHVGIDDETLKNIYQAGSVLVLPLIQCTANNAVLEGLSCGLPVISTQLPNIKTYLNEDVAILTKPNSPAEIVEAIVSFKNEPDSLKVYSKAARARAIQKYDWKMITDQQLSMYDEF